VQQGDVVKMLDDVEAVLKANHAAGISDEYDDLRRALVGTEMRVTKKDCSDETCECEVSGCERMWFAASSLRSAETKYARLDWAQDGLHIQVEEHEKNCLRYLRQRADLLPELPVFPPAAVAMATNAPAAVLPQKVMAAPVLHAGMKVAMQPAAEVAAGVEMVTAATAVVPALPIMAAAQMEVCTVAASLESMMMPGLAIEGGLTVLPGIVTLAAAVPVAIGILSTASQISALTEKYVSVKDPATGLMGLRRFIQKLIDAMTCYSAPNWNCNHFADEIFHELIDPPLFAALP